MIIYFSYDCDTSGVHVAQVRVQCHPREMLKGCNHHTITHHIMMAIDIYTIVHTILRV